MMTLEQLTAHIEVLEIRGGTEIGVSGLTLDSRKVEPGFLFVAVTGLVADGHKYIEQAIARGAVAVMCERMPDDTHREVTYIRVENTEQVAGEVATAFYGRPSERLKLVGVTGTNGKTTIATVLYETFRHMGHKAGLLSTVANYIDGERVPTDHTTPDPVTLNALLARMADAGCEYAFMEVSSHSVVQNRIGGLTFAGGLFTNISRDHLDYHKTFDNYIKAKKLFFDRLPASAFVVTNADDRNGLVMTQNTKARVKTYSVQGVADFRARIVESRLDGMSLRVDGREVDVLFVGRFNVSNLLAVYGAAVELGVDPHEALVALSAARPVNGRFEAMRAPSGYTAIVDYAHTPDALANVLTTIHGVLDGKGRIITVCGAGGNRDKGKRPLMAREAARRSDTVVLTSDNPRFEEPQAIVDDMLAGLDDELAGKVITVLDRRQAIRTACMMARPGDVVLVAGKGHEDYQEIKGVKTHFDDHEELQACFK